MSKKPETQTSPKTKSRRHGYRGYGSPLHKEPGGVIHYPRGFTGVEFPDLGTPLPKRSEVVADELREEPRGTPEKRK